MCGESKRNDADCCIQRVLLPVIQGLLKTFGATSLVRCSLASASNKVSLQLWPWRLVLDVTALCSLPQALAVLLVQDLPSAEILTVAVKAVVGSVCALQV